jgi:hypothetical protein
MLIFAFEIANINEEPVGKDGRRGAWLFQRCVKLFSLTVRLMGITGTDSDSFSCHKDSPHCNPETWKRKREEGDSLGGSAEVRGLLITDSGLLTLQSPRRWWVLEMHAQQQLKE